MIDERMLEDRLATLGLTELTKSDRMLLSFVSYETVEMVKNYCNIRAIPEELTYTVLDMICGKFLGQLYRSGTLSGYHFDYEAAVTSIKEGDTTVNFAQAQEQTPEQQFVTLVDTLANPNLDRLRRFRRLSW